MGPHNNCSGKDGTGPAVLGKAYMAARVLQTIAECHKSSRDRGNIYPSCRKRRTTSYTLRLSYSMYIEWENNLQAVRSLAKCALIEDGDGAAAHMSVAQSLGPWTPAAAICVWHSSLSFSFAAADVLQIRLLSRPHTQRPSLRHVVLALRSPSPFPSEDPPSPRRPPSWVL